MAFGEYRNITFIFNTLKTLFDMKRIFSFLFGLSAEKIVPNKSSCDTMQYTRDELKDVLDRLYKCRDLEISNLWQRSIFLSVFMVLCFTGYGYLLLQIIDSEPSKSTCSTLCKSDYLNIAAIALGCVSLVFSLLWIFMAKASKAWYEVYETAISTFENEYSDILKIPEFNIMGEMGLYIHKMSYCLYSAKAAAFSPSRINIAIGQVCFTVWVLVITLHCALLFGYSMPILNLSIVIIILTIIATLILMCSKWIKSGHLSKHVYDKKGRCIG